MRKRERERGSKEAREGESEGGREGSSNELYYI